MSKTAAEMEAVMIQNLANKTGKSLDEWINIATDSKIDKHRALINYLKDEHGLTYGYANFIAHKTFRSDAGSAAQKNDLIAAQYAGPKAALRPIYDLIITAVKNFGDDVEIAPKKSYVSLRRNKQFTIVQPSTKTRVDVGINLKGAAPTGRLEASGSFNAMVSHRVRLSDKKNVDAELIGWLRQAYYASLFGLPLFAAKFCFNIIL